MARLQARPLVVLATALVGLGCTGNIQGEMVPATLSGAAAPRRSVPGQREGPAPSVTRPRAVAT